uniref:RING-type domain-containing protein n=1 Tax=Sphaeramia orbicularis TaxID=375764 RepID=A0A673BGE9_9TELE
MPLFFKKKKPSDDSKKRLEYQLCRSKEAGADDILDISSCELSEVPSSAFSICKVLQKKVRTGMELSVNLNSAYLSFCLSPQVLDLHENNLTSLPEDMGKLVSLQRDELGRYRSNGLGGIYITVYSTGNRLTELPASVGSLSSLRTLDISDNNITQLPKTLAYIRTLESFTLDAVKMSYPPDSVCTEGTESIQRFLCDELGEEYCPPSQYLLPVLESDCGKQNSDCLDGLEEAWLEQKQQEKLAFERHLEQKQKEHTQLLLMNTSHKENILNSVRQEQERLEQGVSQQQRAQEAERLLILEKVRQAEDDTTSPAMQKMLSDSCAMSLLQKASDSRRQCLVSETYRSMENLDRKFDQMLSLQVLDKSKAIAQILQEEEMQKAAFQALQLQKDSVHGLIRTQIKLIEGELMQLTKLEIKRRSLDAENLQEVLVDQRTALSDLLQQLLKQRDQREQELRQVLAEMELKSESNQQNYWMIQYQRLLDAKPLSLRMQEAGVERELVNLLCKLSAQHYLPILAHNRVTTEALRHMSASDLKKVSVEQEEGEVVPTAPTAPTPSPLRLPNASPIQMPSPPLTPGTPVTPSAPSPVEGPGSSECVVCMETGSQVIFLPCGHVCCCQVCSDALQNCPLCRSTISQRVRLFHS